MSDTKVFTLRNYYERLIPIDDGYDGDYVAAGETMPLRFRKFTVGQLQEFQRGYARCEHPSADRFIYRKSDGDEQATRADGKTYLVPSHEIQRRRLEELSSDQRAAYEQASRDDDAFLAEFCTQAITNHIWLPPGVTVRLIENDGSERVVSTGAGLVDLFGGNLSMLTRLTKELHKENTMSPEEKKASRLLSGSTASSPTPAAEAAVVGATRAATASPAGTADSASSGGASAGPGPILSGSDA